MSFLVAVATSDGEAVNLHFGRAEALNVYEVAPDGAFSFVEQRAIPAVPAGRSCSEGAGCSGGCSGQGAVAGHGACGVHAAGAATEELAARLEGVSYVLASRIGPKMAKALGVRGITALSIELPISQALQKLAVFDTRVNRFRH